MADRERRSVPGADSTSSNDRGAVNGAGRRSRAWLYSDVKNGFIARSHLRALGLGPAQFDGRPIIGIANTWSELTPCNAHLRGLAEAVRRGVLSAGGLPLEFPVMSLGEPFMRPTTMLYRNLMAMEVEEQVRANPLDALVLMTGCDKTTPGALMGAASVDLPTILITGGPILNGKFRGRDVGSGTDIWRMSEGLRAGTVTQSDFADFETCLNRSPGHCMTMGTASTMACLGEALGLMLPGGAGLPAVDSRRLALAERTGALAVRLADHGPRPSDILTRPAFRNAIKVLAALGGSTNAVLHLLALAGRTGASIELDDFDVLARDVPLLVDLMPSGRFLMEDFAYAGGVPALLRELAPMLDLDVRTVDGRTLGELIDAAAPTYNPDVIRPLTAPVQPAGSGIAVLRGNLAPRGAVIKVSAATPELLTHTAPAVVFDSLEDYLAVVDSPDLEVTADSVLVIRGGGPRGYPGMPEIANAPLPARLVADGVTDMVRISDARMSGTAYGTVILHTAPESAIGGPLGLIRTGDIVRLDVPGRRLDVLISEEEMKDRAQQWSPPPRQATSRGWTSLYLDHVEQADRGVDLDFLTGATGDQPPRRAF